MIVGNGRLEIKKNPDGRGVELRFRDGLTKQIFLIVNLSLKGLSHALVDTWGERLPFQYEFLDTVPLGKKREIKYESIPVPIYEGNEATYQEKLNQAIRPWETDGWKENKDSLDNLGNLISYDPLTRTRLMRVEFSRYI